MFKNFLLIFFVSYNLFAQSSWVKWWSQPNADRVWPNNIVKTYDDGYLYHWTLDEYGGPLGYTFTWIYKIDHLGNREWTQEWASGSDYIYTLNQMADSSYLLAGREIVRLTDEGLFAGIIDVDTLLAFGAEIRTSTMTQDGNIVFLAYRYDNWWLFKMDALMNLYWIKHHNSLGADPICIQELPNSNFVVSGTIWTELDSLLLVKFNRVGDLYWSRILGCKNLLVGAYSGLTVDYKENLLLYGYSDSQDKSHLFYFDTLGTILWDKYLTLPDTNLVPGVFVNAIETNDSGFVLSSSKRTGNQVNGVLKIDGTGNLEWWRELPGNPANLIYQKPHQNLVQDQGFLVGIRRFRNGVQQIGIAKTDSAGLLVEINQGHKGLLRNLILHQNYPNPFNTQTAITFELSITGYVELIIFDSLGKKLETLFSESATRGFHSVVWDASKYSTGIYFCRLSVGGNKTLTGKMLLLK